jgi:tetratricopeptide (TPR) repeat protein
MHRFGADAARHFEGPQEEARRHQAAGRRSEALESYRTALERSPRDWYVIGEAAEFVGLQLRNYAAGLELARAAVVLNPWYSTWLWNVLGDSLFLLDRVDDAHEAYLQARRIDPTDPRTNLNLAFTLTQSGQFRSALDAIAAGLARDVRGFYRDRLLEKQQQILAASAGRWLGEQERLTRRAARLHGAISVATAPAPT